MTKSGPALHRPEILIGDCPCKVSVSGKRTGFPGLCSGSV